MKDETEPRVSAGAAPAESADAPGPVCAPAFTAYRVAAAILRIEPAAHNRAWMDATDGRFANRCLPMLMANQNGWTMGSPVAFTAVWNGGVGSADTRIGFDRGTPTFAPVNTHFGNGVVTFMIPFVIRTDPGWNLLVRGPANAPKDGVSPLEGLVETDWTVATFTMNWKLTRPGLAVRFEKDEPICMIVPQRRGELEGFRPSYGREEDLPGREDYVAWRRSRSAFLRSGGTADAVGVRQETDKHQGPRQWQRHYFRGTHPSAGEVPAFEEHQRRLRLRPLHDPYPPAPLPDRYFEAEDPAQAEERWKQARAAAEARLAVRPDAAARLEGPQRGAEERKDS